MKIQILNWQKYFENSKSRERDKCSFCCVPNKIGMGLSQMLSEPDGAAMYGIFCLALGLLSRQTKPRDGHLTDTGRADGRHLTGTELALLWRRPIAEIEKTMAFICQPNIGWAIDLDPKCPPSTRVVPAECPPSTLERREGKGREENGNEDPPPATASGKSLEEQPVQTTLLPGELITPPTRPTKKPAKPREPDPVWDTLAEIFYGGTVPTGQAKAVGAIVRDLKELGANEAKIRGHVKRMKAKWGPDITVSMHAIVKHWAAFTEEACESDRDREINDFCGES
jgi:hypothetical protein